MEIIETTWKILVLILFLTQMVCPVISQLDFAAFLCPDAGNYTANSSYRKNLNTLLSSLSSSPQLVSYGFYNLSTGEEPDKVNAVALCIGDISTYVCSGCVDESSRKILEVCPNRKAGIVWYNQCMVRYSDAGIFGVMNDSDSDSDSIFNGETASDPDGFLNAVRSLMERLRGEAAAGNSTRKMATGEISAGNETVYGLVQCTPDLSSADCDKCISERSMMISEGRIGARIFTPSCVLRYENYIFDTPPAPANATPSPSPLPTTGSNDSKGNTTTILWRKIKTTTIIIIVVSILSSVILVIGIYFILRMRKRKQKISSKEVKSVTFFQESTDEVSSEETIQFDFDTIKVATNEFSDDNKLGQGGFGVVYEGRLSNGQSIAVKRLSRDSGQGNVEFRNEVLMVAKLQHRNLVRLLGFCFEGNERLLIYEFLPNGSLDNFIFDMVKRTILNWERRYKIISGVARGLLYLHEDSRIRIIHRDLKASNILLDEKMNPKIADFGMARLFEMDETRGQTNRIVGTYGYMAPEYAYHGQFSTKSDVYSFGVLILEIISGQKVYCFDRGGDNENLLSFAWKNWKAETPENIIDMILSSCSIIEMIRCIHIGLLCVQANVADRPTMASIVLMLNSFSLTLSLPAQPAFLVHNNSILSNANDSQRIPLQASDNGVSISEFCPR